MYGLVNKALQELVIERGGEALWDRVRAASGVEVETFVGMQPYPDEVTTKLVVAAAEALGSTPSTILEEFGVHWIVFTAQNGYGAYFSLTGSTLFEVLANLDLLHARVQLTFQQFTMPRFRVTDRTERSARLHYRSERTGLASFVVGLVRGLGVHLGTPVRVTQVATRGEGDADHDEFLVELVS
jgi:hypothetical protein